MYRPWLTTPCNPAQPRWGKQSVITSSHNSAAHETCEDTAAPERCSEIPLSHSSQITDSVSQCWCQCSGSLSSNKKHQLTLAHSSPRHYETLSGKCRGGQSKRVRMHIPVRLPCNPNAVILLFNLKIVTTEDNIAQLFPSLVSKHYKLCWRPGSWYSNWTPCQGCQIGGGGVTTW